MRPGPSRPAGLVGDRHDRAHRPHGRQAGRRSRPAPPFLPGAIAGGLLTFGSLRGCSETCCTAPAGAGRLPGRSRRSRCSRRSLEARDQDRAADPPPAARALAAGRCRYADGRRPLLAFCSGSASRPSSSLSVSGPSPACQPRRRGPRARAAARGLLRAGPGAPDPRSRAARRSRPAGIRATELMCERAGVYLGLRRGDAAALRGRRPGADRRPGSAGAAGTSVAHATDPSATADALLFQRLGGPSGDQPRRPGDSAAGQPSGDRRTLRRHRPGRLGPALRPRHPGADRARSRRPAPTRSRSRTAGSPTAPRREGRCDLHPLHRQPGGARPPLPGRLAGWTGQLSRPGGRRERPPLRDRHPAGSRVVQEADGHAQAPCAGAARRGSCSSIPPVEDARSRT